MADPKSDNRTWLEWLATVATVLALLFAGVQLQQAARQHRENLALQSSLTVLDAQQRITDSIFAIAEMNVDARAADPDTRAGAMRSLAVAVPRLDALIVTLDEVASSQTALKEAWSPVFAALCAEMQTLGYLADNQGGKALEGTQNACSS